MALSIVYRNKQSLVSLASGQIIEYPGAHTFKRISEAPAQVNPHDIHTTQLFPVGTKLTEGRNVYRYALFGGTIAAGRLVQAEGPDGAHDALDLSGTTDPLASPAIGSTILEFVDSLTLVLNEYEGGELHIGKDTGLGYEYPILANEAASAATLALLQIEHGLKVALDSTSDGILIKSPWREVIICPTTLTAAIVGVSVSAQLISQWGWLKTKGRASIPCVGTAVIGAEVTASDTTAGSVEPIVLAEAAPNTILPGIIGRVVDVGLTTEQSLIDINFE